MTRWLLCAVMLGFFAFHAQAAEEIYVRMQGDTPSVLSSGGEFTAEKGDCYPFIGYDAGQTMIQLKFGPFSFWTHKENGAFVPDAEAAAAGAKYHADVTKFEAMAGPALRAGASPISTASGASGEAIMRQLGLPLRRFIRQELADRITVAKAGTTISAFPVDAMDSVWQNTGIRVRAGQHVKVEAAEGEKWNLGEGLTTAAGYTFAEPNSGMPVFHKGEEATDYHWGALICTVGDGQPQTQDQRREIEIGIKREFTAESSGYVFLICNDNPELPNGGNGFDNNSGIIHAKVTVTDDFGNADIPRGQAGAKVVRMDADQGGSSPADEGSPAVTIAREMEEPLQMIIAEELSRELGARRPAAVADRFPVDAAQPTWQNSGVLVKPGQHVVVETVPGETWDMGWGQVSPNGHSSPHDVDIGDPVYHSGTPNVDWHWGGVGMRGGSESERN